MGSTNPTPPPPPETGPQPIGPPPFDALNAANINQQALWLYQQGYGMTPYPGSTYVPMSDASRSALAGIEALAAAQGPALAGALNTAQQAAASGGITPEMSAAMAPLASIAGGQYSVGSQGLYDQIFGQAAQPSAAQNYLAGLASGTEGIGTGGMFADIFAEAGVPAAAAQYLTATARGDYLAEPNPYLQTMIDDRSVAIANQVKDVYSGMGRYGSSALDRDLTDRLAQFQAGVLSENYEAERARQMQAAQLIDAANRQRLDARYQAALGRTNVDAANIENRIGAARSIDQSQGDFLGAQLSAAGGYTNAQSADIGNIFGASSTLADIYAGGMNRALSAANAIPGLGQAQYAPATWLAQVGAARESDRAAQLADLVARYNYQQQAPMEMLNWLKAISGDGGVYSPTFAELPGVTQSPWFSVLG